MINIIPLAGPDIYSSNYGIKPFIDIDGAPLIQRALNGRPWYSENNTFIFVLKENPERAKLQLTLKNLYPNSHFLILEDYTRGALLSVLAATSIIQNFNEPIVVDLVDILFSGQICIEKIFSDEKVGGVLPVFQSDNEKYSYAVIKDGYVEKTREKIVISSHASTGVYIFRDMKMFLSGVIDSLKHEEEYSYNSNLFLCPAMNGIIDVGKKVLPINVKLERSISNFIHDMSGK